MGLAMCSSRTLLFILALLFLAATLVSWGLSGFVLASYRQVSAFGSAYFTWVPATVMIVAGFIFLVAGVSGCATACTKRRACSITFFVFVALTFVTLIAVTTLVFVYKKRITHSVLAETNVTFNEYGEPGQQTITDQVDFVQSNLYCCGAENYTSWEETNWAWHNRSNMVPLSCCKNATSSTECKNGNLNLMNHDVERYIFTEGCVTKMEQFLQSYMRYMAGGTVGFLLVLLLGIVASCVVLCKKEANPYFSLS